MTTTRAIYESPESYEKHQRKDGSERKDVMEERGVPAAATKQRYAVGEKAERIGVLVDEDISPGHAGAQIGFFEKITPMTKSTVQANNER